MLLTRLAAVLTVALAGYNVAILVTEEAWITMTMVGLFTALGLYEAAQLRSRGRFEGSSQLLWLTLAAQLVFGLMINSIADLNRELGSSARAAREHAVP